MCARHEQQERGAAAACGTHACAWHLAAPLAADGTQLVAGVGNRVLVYDAVDGDLLHALKGHKVSSGASSSGRLWPSSCRVCATVCMAASSWSVHVPAGRAS